MLRICLERIITIEEILDICLQSREEARGRCDASMSYQCHDDIQFTWRDSIYQCNLEEGFAWADHGPCPCEEYHWGKH